MRICSYEKLENGVKRDFPTLEKSLTIKGEINESYFHELDNADIEIISIDDKDLEKFNWKENFKKYGQWSLGKNLVENIDKVVRGGINSPYLWNNALIKAKEEYWIVSFDFFEDGLLVG